MKKKTKEELQKENYQLEQDYLKLKKEDKERRELFTKFLGNGSDRSRVRSFYSELTPYRESNVVLSWEEIYFCLGEKLRAIDGYKRILETEDTVKWLVEAEEERKREQSEQVRNSMGL